MIGRRVLALLPGSWRLSSVGQCWLPTALLVLGIGLFKNINLLALLGDVLVVVLFLNLLVAGRGLRRLRARQRLLGPVFAGSPGKMEVLVEGPDRGACLSVRFEARPPGAVLTWFVESLQARSRLTLTGAVLFPQRGRFALAPLTATSGHPFGLVLRRLPLAPAHKVIVLPRLGRLQRELFRRHLRSVEMGDVRPRGRGRPNPAAHDELHGLRTYRTGDSPRAIHWRTSARRGMLMVRELDSLPGDDLLLVFDPSCADHGPVAEERFEAAVSLAATICWEWCRRGGDRLGLLTLGPGGRMLAGVTGPEHAQRLLECLAELRPVSPAEVERTANLGPLDRAGKGLAVVLVSVGPSRLAATARQRLGRPLACLDAVALAFYQPPQGGTTSHAS